MTIILMLTAAANVGVAAFTLGQMVRWRRLVKKQQLLIKEQRRVLEDMRRQNALIGYIGRAYVVQREHES